MTQSEFAYLLIREIFFTGLKMKTLTAALLLLASIAQVHAITLFQEPTDGELGDAYSTPTYLGSLTADSYMVSGSMDNGDMFDTFSYDIAQGHQLQSINIISYSNPSIDNYWSGLCVAVGAYSGTCLEYINFSTADVGLDVLQFDSAPGAQDAGLYFTGLSYVASDQTQLYFADYQIELVVTAVPVPAALWLFGSGLIGIAAFAKRRIRA